MKKKLKDTNYILISKYNEVKFLIKHILSAYTKLMLPFIISVKKKNVKLVGILMDIVNKF